MTVMARMGLIEHLFALGAIVDVRESVIALQDKQWMLPCSCDSEHSTPPLCFSLANEHGDIFVECAFENGDEG